MNFFKLLYRSTALAALTIPIAAFAFPTQPIEWVVPYAAGGGSDVVARTIASEMTKTLGQPIIINNKPGAGTNIGAAYVAKASADGHVVLTADTATLAANPFLYSKPGYSAEKDFVTIGLMARFPMILVVNPQNVPVKDLKEFLAWAKAQPNAVAYGTPGAGSPHHLATELFSDLVGIKLTHVPYKGAAPAVQDVIAGQVPMMFVDTASGAPHIRAGKLRAIGVASPKRIQSFDTVPTLDEQGLKGFEAYAWQGMVAPAKTPAAAVDVLNKALLKAIDTPAVKERFQALGLEAIPSSPQDMAAYAKAEREKWGKVIHSKGIKLD
ncbi:Bug family tripartite tricarboxylate transporter substrate binding protein [Noviherbaspirillum sp. Root189]|uniref:Bug family tripartite tricarboxylate transporter substrate binding protein n=1 Tax=Noviherbaspirillum sp. Root189 TaxID=1736487 RepID=UPI000709B02A|nr:tripartite tricarboxylate transporter substrate binding protein [Noviherbaspirillum sp. Root189]KRB88920.1 ABC transporter substrate-binding protein [Noviherbaspirillum sp. Root189]